MSTKIRHFMRGQINVKCQCQNNKYQSHSIIIIKNDIFPSGFLPSRLFSPKNTFSKQSCRIYNSKYVKVLLQNREEDQIRNRPNIGENLTALPSFLLILLSSLQYIMRLPESRAVDQLFSKLLFL